METMPGEPANQSTHAPLRSIGAVGEHRARRPGVVDPILPLATSEQRADVVATRHVGIDQAHIAKPCAIRPSEQAHAIDAGAIDAQMVDHMAQAIEAATEGRSAGLTDRNETGPAVPARRGGRIDVRAQHVVAGEIAAHALQIGAGSTAFGTEAGEDDPVDRRAVAALQGTEAAAGGEVDRRVDAVSRHVARCRRILSVEQGQPRRATAVQRREDGDAAAGLQGEPMGGPRDRCLDRQVVIACGQDGHVAVAQPCRHLGV